MKNSIFFILFLISALAFTSCDEELEIWDSSAFEYSGRYVVELQAEDQSETYYDYSYGMEIDLYNTAADVENEIWFEDLHSDIPLKVKLFLDGTAESFGSKSLEFGDLGINADHIDLPDDEPSDAGLTITEDRSYLRGGVVEGKLLKEAATTIGGNVADSVYVKIVLKSGTATFESFAYPEDQWADPSIPEYFWERVSMDYDATLDETYVISGHRYTGMPEDQY
jgi:hypothetical protein